MVSPDRLSYWDGESWVRLPGEDSRWDGSSWHAKPPDVEAHWDGSEWLTKPEGVPSEWNGEGWSIAPDGVEARWDGSEWQSRPSGRAYWNGRRWVEGFRPLVKFGIPVVGGVLFVGLVAGGFSYHSTSTKAAIEESRKARQDAAYERQAAAEQQRLAAKRAEQEELLARRVNEWPAIMQDLNGAYSIYHSTGGGVVYVGDSLNIESNPESIRILVTNPNRYTGVVACFEGNVDKSLPLGSTDLTSYNYAQFSADGRLSLAPLVSEGRNLNSPSVDPGVWNMTEVRVGSISFKSESDRGGYVGGSASRVSSDNSQVTALWSLCPRPGLNP